jgi:hypothetical protein
MTRRHPTLAILLLILSLLLLPLQGHARVALADAPMPCAMEHHGMHGAEAPSAVPSTHPCDTGSHCGTECQECAGCGHFPAGIAVMFQPPLPQPEPPGYAPPAGQAYTSITLFADHPPPRVG